MGDELDEGRGRDEDRSADYIILGAIEAKRRWCFQAKYIPRIYNKIADGISRWKREDVQSYLTRKPVGQVQVLGEEEQQKQCSQIVPEDTPWAGFCAVGSENLRGELVYVVELDNVRGELGLVERGGGVGGAAGRVGAVYGVLLWGEINEERWP